MAAVSLKKICDRCKMFALPKGLQSRNGEEVTFMETIFEFLKLVGANVMSHYVCKWLDKLLRKW